MKQFVVIYFVGGKKWAKVLSAVDKDDVRERMIVFAEEKNFKLKIFEILEVGK